MTASARSTRRSASSPRSEIARLIERPRSARRRARVGTPLVDPHSAAAAGEEAGEQATGEPAADDGDVVGSVRVDESTRAIVGKRLGGPPAVVVRRVQRHRGEADDVRLAGVDDDAVLVPQPSGDARRPRRRAARAARRAAAGSRGVTSSIRPVVTSVEQRLEVAREPHAALAQRRHADLVEQLERRTQRAHRQDRRVGDLPAVGARRRSGNVGAISKRVAAAVLHQPSKRGMPAAS